MTEEQHQLAIGALEDTLAQLKVACPIGPLFARSYTIRKSTDGPGISFCVEIEVFEPLPK